MRMSKSTQIATLGDESILDLPDACRQSSSQKQSREVFGRICRGVDAG